MSVFLQTNENTTQRETGAVKIIGIGGYGSNAVNFLINSGIKDAEFICAQTTHSALETSRAENRILMGWNALRGMGAESDPQKGEEAAINSTELITQMLSGASTVFVIAGLGGGTGTGAAPVVADIAKSIGALVVGIVATPFSFEGEKRNLRAQEGLAKLKEKVDVLTVLQNDKLKGENATDQPAFELADKMLLGVVQGIIGISE